MIIFSKNWTHFSTIPLHLYSQNFYDLVTLHFDKLTEKHKKNDTLHDSA